MFQNFGEATGTFKKISKDMESLHRNINKIKNLDKEINAKKMKI